MPRGIRTHDPSVRPGGDSSCLKPRGHCDRRVWFFIKVKFGSFPFLFKQFYYSFTSLVTVLQSFLDNLSPDTSSPETAKCHVIMFFRIFSVFVSGACLFTFFLKQILNSRALEGATALIRSSLSHLWR
jgi:hypothetical protein